jgi:hypothetical protein
MTREPRVPFWIACAERAYALSLYAYPRAFRAEFGEDMRQVFRDRCLALAARPASVRGRFLVDMFGDWSGGLFREHLLNPTGDAYMKRFALIMLMAVSAAGLYFRPSLEAWTYERVEARKTQQHRQENLDAAARLRRVADRAAQHDDAMSQLVAAHLYADASMYAFFASDPSLKDLDRRSSAARTSALALGQDRAAVLWRAYVMDPSNQNYGPSPPHNAVLDRLLAIDADNAAVWQADFSRAVRSGDEARARVDLASMRRASRYDTYEAEFVRAEASAFAPELAAGGSVSLDTALDYGVHLGEVSIYSAASLLHWCRNATDSTVRGECRDIAARMILSGSMRAQSVGMRLSAALAKPGELMPLQSSWRNFLWVRSHALAFAGFGSDELPDVKPARTRFLAALGRTGSWLDAAREIMRAQKIGAAPPPGWHGSEESYLTRKDI